MAKPKQPEFEPGTVFDSPTLATDLKGVLWWIDPEWKEIKRAYPGEPLEHDEEGENTPSEFSDYVRQ